MSVRSTPPAVVPAAAWRFPAVEERSLPNGVRVLSYDCAGQHVVAVSLVFPLPLALEPRELEGVAGLMGRCLTQGAAGRTAEQFTDALALCGADLQAGASPDAFTVRLSAPSTRLDDALALMADAVRQPSFDVGEFEHAKRLRLQDIEQSHAYPQQVAVERLNSALFGDQRVGRPTGGAAETVARVSRDDVADFAAEHLRPAGATFVIAGDFSAGDPYDALVRGFGDWQVAGEAFVPADLPQVSDRAQILLVDWPDSTQATIRVGAPGISRADPRWPAMFVANYAVGGNFSSRINTVLREQKGVTYGASSSLDTGRGAGLVAISTAVRTDATAESIADLVSILREADGSLTDDEVETAVRAATDSAALGFERADAVVSRVELLLTQDLPLDHVDTNLGRIRQVTTADANTAYGDVVRPDGLTIVVVGDASQVREPLEALGYAPVELITPP